MKHLLKLTILCLVFVAGSPLYAQTTWYMATTGSDANACTVGSKCLTLNRAYTVAAAGDTIDVAAGSYAAQTVTATAKSNFVFVRPSAGASPTFAHLTIRTRFLNIDGITMPQGESGGFLEIANSGNLWSNPPPGQVVISNMSGKSIFLVADDVTITGNVATGTSKWGNFDGCNSSNQEDVIQAWQLPDSGGTYHASNRITLDGLIVHDITDHNNTCSDVPPPAQGRHVDCMQILAGHFITVRNSIFYNCATSDIIARPFRDTLNDLLFENNFFQDVINPGSALSMGASGDTFGGTNIIRNNYIGSTGPTCSPANCMRMYGNIVSVGSCGANIVWDGNVFEQSWSAQCGTNSKKAQPLYVGPTPSPSYQNGIQPNYHLAANDTVAVNSGSIVSFPATDIDGDARTIAGQPDAGADERGGAPPPPEPQTLTLRNVTLLGGVAVK